MDMDNIIIDFEKNFANQTALLIVSNEEKPRIIYYNAQYLHWLNLPKKFNLEGFHISEVPHHCSEYADQFTETERLAIQGQHKIASITTGNFGGEQTIIYGEDVALKNAEGKAVACGITLRKVEIFTGRDLFLKQRPAHVTLYPPTAIFTDKEWNLLYLLLIGFARNEIEKILKISKSSIEYRVQSCLTKTGTVNSRQLIEYCLIKKWDAYIPPFFIQQGHIRLV